MKKNTLFIFILLELTVPCFSQNISFEAISDKDGLVNSHVTSILKDARGYMWFGTYNGLSRFDGYSYFNYLNDTKDSLTIAGNQIRCLFETSTKHLLVGFQYNGLCLYDKKKDNFQRFAHAENDSNSLGHDYVLTIFEDKKGRVWIGTRKGLDLFDLKTKKFKHYTPFNKKEMPFVTSIEEGGDGELWLYGIGNKICKFNPDKNTYEYISFKSESFGDETFNRGGFLKFDTKGNLWISCENEGVFVLDTSTWKCIQKLNTQNKSIATNAVMWIEKLKDGTMWIGTDGAGIYVYDISTKKTIHLENNYLDPSTLCGNAVYTIKETADGIVWVGTYSAGVCKWAKDKKKFKGFNSRGAENKRLSNKSVLAITETQDGTVWLGTDGGGLNRFDPKSATIDHFNTQNGLCSDVIKSACPDDNGNLWLGTYKKGLCLWSPNETKSLRHFMPSQKESNLSISSDNVWSMLYSTNTLYLGMLSTGLDILNTTNDMFKHNPLDKIASKNLYTANVFALTEDTKGNIWIATETFGVICYNPKTNESIRFIKGNSLNNSLTSDEIRDVFVDSKGNVWFATVYGGLFRLLDFDTKSFESYSLEHGLNTVNVLCILEDDKGMLWVSTDKGVSSFNPVSKEFKNYGVEDGLLSKEFNYNSKLKARNSFLYFGGVDGFNYFHPDSIKSNAVAPNVAITKFYLQNEPILPSTKIGERNILHKTIDLTEKIDLEYSDNIISFEFSALEYISPKKNKYAYLLKGFDTKWHYTNADMRLATYTNLSPGTYTLEVKATNNDGVWGKPKSLIIVVNPPWYMTIWFKCLVIVLIMIGLLTYYYRQIRLIKKQNAYLEEEVKKRTYVIHQQQLVKDKFYSIVAHDLRNPVTALSVLSEMLSSEMKNIANRSQSELMKNIELSAKKLKELVVNLLEWTKSQSTMMLIQTENIHLYDAIMDNVEIHKASALLKGIKISAKTIKGCTLYADRKMLDTILRNIISNAIKFTKIGGEITIETTVLNPDTIKIKVQDNGIGMTEETIKHLFSQTQSISTPGTNNEKGTGLGLAITKEFIELNKGTFEIESTIGVGSSFTIYLPGKLEKEIAEETELFVADKNSLTLENELKNEFKGRTVLLVEDDESIGKVLISTLQPYFNVQITNNVKDALQLTKRNLPDLIVSDIHMPDEDGISFCKKIKTNKETSHIPFLLITAATSSSIQLDGLNAGADAYILKPFDKTILLKTINNLFQTLENVKMKFSSNTSTIPSELTENEKDQELLEKIITFIIANIGNEKLDGDMIATSLNCSKRLLYQKLKTLAGMTVNEFIKSIRLKKSAQLLLEGKMNITEISFDMGFNEPSYFTKVFSKHFGMTPKDYVKKNNEIRESKQQS